MAYGHGSVIETEDISSRGNFMIGSRPLHRYVSSSHLVSSLDVVVHECIETIHRTPENTQLESSLLYIYRVSKSIWTTLYLLTILGLQHKLAHQYPYKKYSFRINYKLFPTLGGRPAWSWRIIFKERTGQV